MNPRGGGQKVGASFVMADRQAIKIGGDGNGRVCRRRRVPEELIVNLLDLSANLTPIEFGQNGGACVGTEFGGESTIVEQSHDASAESFVVMVRDDECVVEMANTLGPTGKGDDRFAREHIVKQLDWMTRAFRPGNNCDIGEREVTWKLLQRVWRNPNNRIEDTKLGREFFMFLLVAFGDKRTNDKQPCIGLLPQRNRKRPQ